MKKKSKRDKRERKDKKRRLSSDVPISDKSIKEEQSIKKVKFESASTTVKGLTFPSKYTTELKVEVEEADSTKDPVIVSFPAGIPASITNAPIHSNDEDNEHTSPPVFSWTRARKASSKGRILHGADDTCTYSAMNEGRGQDGRLTKF